MARSLRWVRVETDLALRAAAISLVAFNHANPALDTRIALNGGMRLLMVISGFFFARMLLARDTREEAQAAVWRFGMSIFLPSLLMVLFFAVLFLRVDLLEILFVKNFISPERTAKFPTWYPQVMTQMLIGIFLVLAIPGLFARIKRHPVMAATVAFVCSLLTYLVTRTWFGATALLGHLPHLYLWNFALGWIVYAWTTQTVVPAGRFVAFGCLVLTAVLVTTPANGDFYSLIIGGGLLVFAPVLRLPRPAALLIRLVGLATFTIFLWHRFFFEVYEDLAGLPTPQGGWPMWAFGMAMSVGLWVAWRAFLSSLHRVKWQLRKAGQAAVPASARAPVTVA